MAVPIAPITSVAAVCRERAPRLLGIPHIVVTISDFTGGSDSWTFLRACKSRSLPLLRCVCAREALSDAPPMDPNYREWLFNCGVTIAAKRGDFETVRWLAGEYMPAAEVTDGVGAAAKNGHLPMVKWFVEQRGNVIVGAQTIEAAAYAGAIDVLELLWRHLPGDTVRQYVLDRRLYQHWPLKSHEWANKKGNVCESVLLSLGVREGRMDVLRSVAHRLDREYSSSRRAARGDLFGWITFKSRSTLLGVLFVWTWLGALLRLWFGRLLRPAGDRGDAGEPDEGAGESRAGDGARNDADGFDAASARFPITLRSDLLLFDMNPGCLKLLVDTKFPWLEINFSDAMIRAARQGSLGLVRSLYDAAGSCPAGVIDEATRNGHLGVVKWLHGKAESCTTSAMDNAASGGHLATVKWLHAHRSEGCTTNAMDWAACNGHFHVVKWLHENRSEGCTTAAMDNAAWHGHLDVVKWLHENRSEGCTTKAMDAAAEWVNMDVVNWLHENRPEGCTTAAMDGAAEWGKLDVVKWLHENRSEGCMVLAMDSAAAAGRLNIVKWLHENRSEGCTTRAMDDAAVGYFEVMMFLHQNRTEGCTELAFSTARSCWRRAILNWLHAHYKHVLQV